MSRCLVFSLEDRFKSNVGSQRICEYSDAIMSCTLPVNDTQKGPGVLVNSPRLGKSHSSQYEGREQVRSIASSYAEKEETNRWGRKRRRVMIDRK